MMMKIAAVLFTLSVTVLHSQYRAGCNATHWCAPAALPQQVMEFEGNGTQGSARDGGI
jgi:hypothetical protein